MSNRWWVYQRERFPVVIHGVLLVTIVIHSLLERKELQEKLEKINILIGVFFSVLG